MVRAGAGDADGMREHLDRAITIATESGRASARCEALARLAIEAARLVTLGARDWGADPGLTELVEGSAARVKALLPLLDRARHIVVVEASDGQLEDEMRLALSHAGAPPVGISHVRRLGGILPAQREIVEAARAAASKEAAA